MLLAVCMAAASLLPPAAPVSRMSRRVALLQGAAGVALLRPLSASAAPAASEAALVGEVRAIQKALDLTSLFGLIDEEKFDSVRSVLKVPPVGDAWQQSQNGKNPFRKLADLRDDVELFETVDEIAAALQLADQYLYSNTFIYTQPGNGKLKIKEPKQQLQIAVDKMGAFASS